ncbi:MAG: AAA family ATPase [Bifidobacteriaceae bacterium]|nr:AAA family ATPase [Bifidobacteriaceae bacterium]
MLDQYLERAWTEGAPEAQYPFDLPAVRALATGGLAFHPKVTYLVGENGSGKSTLLEALAVALGFNAEGGTRNFDFATRESHSGLHEYLRVARPRPIHHGFFFRAESFYNVATEIDSRDLAEFYGGRSLHERSHGEAFLELARARFGVPGVYLLDEPEAALSPARQLNILSIMDQAIADGAQFVIATHSPILLAYRDAWIYTLDATGPRRTTYDQAEPVQLTRTFLADPARVLHYLLEDD